MIFHTLKVVLTLFLISCFENAFAAQLTKVSADLRQHAQESGMVRVFVEFDMPWHPEGLLTSSARFAQRNSIASNHRIIKAALAGSTHRVTAEFETVSGIGLEISPQALIRLENMPQVKRILQSHPDRIQLSNTIPLVGASSAWTSGTGHTGSGWTIAIIDSGVDSGHPFLAGKIVYEVCFSSGFNCPNNDVYQLGSGAAIPCTFHNECGHGTLVAGIAAGKGSTFSGVAKDATIMALRVVSNNAGALVSWPEEQTLALERVLNQSTNFQIAAVNISLGGSVFSDQTLCDSGNPGRKQVIENLRVAGIPVIVASGNNELTNSITVPACISSAVSVGSTTKSDAISSFSNSAPFLSLVAPGGFGNLPPDSADIHSSIPGGGFGDTWGTSFAAPHVSGAWAIMKQKNPTATVGQILNALQTTGVKITDTRAGANSRVNCRIQIDQALNNIPNALVTLPIAESVAYGINNCGQIVGTEYVLWSGYLTDTSGLYNSVVYNGPLETPWGFYDLSEATSVNNKGEVHGYYCCGNYGDRGFKRNSTGTTIASVDTPNTNDIYGNNDFGDLVGTYWLANPPWIARNFRHVNGATSETPDYAPRDINNMRRIVGVGGAGGYSGIITNEQGIVETEFDPPGSQWTVPSSINESGHVVGCYMDSAWIWNSFERRPDGNLFSISIPGATDSCAYGINDSGQIVGYYNDAGGGYYSFVDLSW